jgi:tRNA(Ile)-lysidine synthetase-like protein
MDHVQECVARSLAGLGVTPEHALGVACSGGPDSAALAHACLTLARAGRLGPVTLLHVHHGLRDDADQDAEVVRALALQGGGRAVIRAAQVDRERASLEAAARDARYAVLDALAVELGLRWIAVAHTASDQAETVLMRLMRGTGIFGLAGIPAARGIYLRPLLGVTRAEIEAYCLRFDVATVADPMNRDEAFLRNRVRHTWLPALRRENPRIDDALCRLAGAAAEERAVLEYAAATLLERAQAPARARDPQAGLEDEIVLAVTSLAQAPAAVRHRAVSMAAARAGLGPLEARHLEAIDALLTRSTGGTATLSLPGGTAVRAYDRILFRKRLVHRLGMFREDASRADPGESESWEPAGPMDPALDDGRIQVTGADGPYVVRCWQAGDRMRPARLRGRSRKLGDLFIDAKVPRRLRTRARVVIRVADGAIVWAEHIGPAFGADVSVSLTPGNPLASNKMSD